MVFEDGPVSHEGREEEIMRDTGSIDTATPPHSLDTAHKSAWNGSHSLESTSGELETETEVVIESKGIIRSLEQLALQEDGYDGVEDDEKDETDQTDDLPKAPDGGYGWIICAACFLHHMIIGGLARSEGLFFLQFKSKFGTTAQMATWPGSLMSTVNLFMGPVCATVVNRFSVRTSFMIGTFLCCAGMILNGYAPNIYFLFFSHTILGGFGRGLLSGVLLLNMYFDKHRSLATGVAMSGVGVGSLWVVPLTQYLFDVYGFTGAFLILGGIVANLFVITMLLRPLRMHLRFTQAAAKREKTEDLVLAEEGVALKSLSNGYHDTDETHEKNGGPTAISNTSKLISDSDNAPVKMANKEEITDDTSDQPLTLFTSEHPSEADHQKLVNQNMKEPLVEYTNDVRKKSSASSHHHTQERDGCLKSSIKILFPVEYKKKKTEKRKKGFEWTLVKDIPFMVFLLATFLFILAFKTSLTFLPAIALSKGLTDTEAALMLTISGALDTFGRLAIGFLMDLRPLRPLRPYMFNLMYFLIAGASFLVPFLGSFASFSVICSLYGLLTGASITQKLVVLVDIVGRDVLPSSLGIMKVFQGFGTLIGPPLAGALRDALGSYDSSFYLGGASVFGAALLLALSNLLLRLRKRTSKK